MAVKQTGRKVYKSMTGKQIDMDLLRQRNELTPAVGNARVNARGDELGPGGKIIKKREDVLRDFQDDHVETVPFDEPAPVVESEPEARIPTVEVDEPAPTPTPKTTRASAGKTKAETKVEDEWVEDDDGNFVKKGE